MTPADPMVGLLMDDHARLDRILESAAESLRGAGVARAQVLLDLFSDQLYHHMELEERRIFPALAARVEDGKVDTDLLCGQHAEIRRLLEEVRTRLGEGDAGAASEALAELQGRMAEHERCEEQAFYPLVGLLAREVRESD